MAAENPIFPTRCAGCLGEQSAKTLRGAKMEDVIFNGTEKRRRLAFCEVTLVFDNERPRAAHRFCRSGRFPPGVSQRRRRISDQRRALPPAATSWTFSAIRASARTAIPSIGQGRIDEILSAKSEDRRQVFEEAAGIVKYKARKHGCSATAWKATQTNLEPRGGHSCGTGRTRGAAETAERGGPGISGPARRIEDSGSERLSHAHGAL